MADEHNMRRVTAIRNGTVIDHIKAGRGKKVLDILGLSGSETTISLLINVQSKIQKRKDIIKIDNDISHFLKADTTEVRSESNTCPSGKGLWNMKLVTDLYGYETGMFVLFVDGISFSFLCI